MEENKNLQSDLSPEELQSMAANIAEQAKETIDRNMEVVEQDKPQQQRRYYNRRARREVQKMFEKRGKGKSTNFDLKGWAEKIRMNQQNGKKLHEKYVALQMEEMEQFFMAKEASIRANMKARGASKAEIDSYIEFWYENTKIWNTEAA